jgi:hypothetical protein
MVGGALADQFNLAQAPFLREERFERAVEAKEREPTLARHGLNPVAAFHARRLGWAEINRRGAVGVRSAAGVG